MVGPAKPKRASSNIEIALAVGLTLSAGFVDALGALLLGGVLVAHMSGNTAIGAVSLEQSNWPKALARLTPIPWFLTGIVLGRVVARWLGPGRERRFSLLLGIEVLALLGFVLLSWSTPGPRGACVALLAVAMGVQSAAMRQAAGYDVRTTFVTGMLVAFVDEVIDFIVARDSNAARPGFHALIWASFFVGAFAGAAAQARFGARAAVVPILLVSAMAAIAPARLPALRN